MFKRGGVWWTCIRYEDKKVQKSLETDDRRLAQAIEAKIRAEIAEGKFFDKPVGQSKTFKDMMEKFMQEHAPKVSKNMQKSYASSLKHLATFWGNSKLSDIKPKLISEYKVLRKNKGIKPATINRELAMLSKAFNLAVKEWEWIRDNPVSRVPKEKENNERDRWLNAEDEKRLLENSLSWLKEIIVFDLNTGLRQDELLSLQWSRVDLFRKIIIIQESKNGKPRTIPLTQTALDILTERSKVINLKSGLVFPNSKGEMITRNVLAVAFGKAKEKTGIEDFRFHDLRHCFGSRLAQRGVDIYT